MKVIKRLDSLGRIIIPKEIRTALKMNEGDNLELKLQNKQLIITVHSQLNEKQDVIKDIIDYVATLLNKNILITDRHYIIAASKQIESYYRQEMSNYLLNCLKRREDILEEYNKSITITKEPLEISYIIKTIIVNGEEQGLVIVFSFTEKVSITDDQIASVLSHFLTSLIT